MDLLLTVPGSPSMGHKSQAKMYRSVRRITKFLERKPPILSITVQDSINILPVVKELSIVHVLTTHVPSQTQPKQNRDFSKTIVISLTPEPSDNNKPLTYSHFMKMEKKEMMNRILEMNGLQSTNYRHRVPSKNYPYFVADSSKIL